MILLTIVGVFFLQGQTNGGEISLKLIDANTPIKHVYIDFDHTITVDGLSKDIVLMFCRGEDGVKCNCSRLPGGVCNGTDAVSVNAMVTELETLPNGGLTNLTNSLGGQARVDAMRAWLKGLRTKLDGNIWIVSTSWYPVTGLQWQTYLKKASDLLDLGFDMDHIISLADPGPGLSADKGGKIKENMAKHGIKMAEALFTDDSSGNIATAKGVCNTLHLPKRMGLDGTDRAYINALAFGVLSSAVTIKAGLLVAMTTLVGFLAVFR